MQSKIKWIIKFSTTSKMFRLTLLFCFLSFFFLNFCKCLLFIVSMSFFTFRSHFFDYFWFWSFFLNVSAERITQKIIDVKNVIEKNIAFVAIAFDFLQIISSNEIAISNRNAKKKAQNEQVFSAKKNLNDVEQQYFDAFSSSLSFDASKSNDQKNFDFSVDFSALLIEQKATTLIEIWCEFCIKCVKSIVLCVRVVNNINFQRCAN